MREINRRNQVILLAIAALLATTALAGILIWESRTSAPRHVLFFVGEPERGAELFYGSKHCGICHAVNGSGGRVGPDLSGKQPEAPALGWLTAVLWNHQPGMWRLMRGGKTTYPKMNQEEMADVLAFLYLAGNADPKGDVKAGEMVFRNRGCVRCHSVRSSGGTGAPELTGVTAVGGSSAWTRAMWNHAQSMVGPVTKELGAWPEFRPGEMNNLIAYVSAGTPAAAAPKQVLHGSAERGWKLFQTSCLQCHAVRGSGGKAGPELGPGNDLPLSTANFAGVLWNHAPGMLKQAAEKGAAVPQFQGNEVEDILMFLSSLRYFEPTGSPFLGERLFAQRGCAGCHGAQAEGGPGGPKLRTGADAFTAVKLAAALWSHGPNMQARAEELGIAWPTLEAADAGNIVSFLNSAGHADTK